MAGQQAVHKANVVGEDEPESQAQQARG